MPDLPLTALVLVALLPGVATLILGCNGRPRSAARITLVSEASAAAERPSPSGHARAWLIPASLMLLLAVAGCRDDDEPVDAGPPPAAYSVGGTVTHLDSGPLVVSNGAETLTVPQGASTFAFTRPLSTGAAYAVTIAAQPTGMTCVVANPSGTINGAAVTNVAITCSTLVSQPLAIGVSAAGSLDSNASRIFLPVTQVGTNATTINAILDTGSSGTVLRAADIFPASMLTANGFVFPAGQTSLTYNGITVTNVVASRTYGAQSDLVTELTGNLGFAQITFGRGVRATTTVVPILFVFQMRSNGNVVSTTNFANLIGVNPSLSPIAVMGTPQPTTPTPCTPQSTGTCGLASPFRYFSYGAGMDKGFVIDRVTFAACNIATAGACPVTPSLTLGVTSSVLAGFTVVNLSSCSTVTLADSASERVCSQVISSVTVTSGNATFTGPAIFDSGFPSTRLSVPAGMTFPDTLSNGSTVRVAAGAGFAYAYQTGTGYLRTNIVTGAATGDFSNLGIGFFAQNSLLVDYSRAIEGWRNGA